MAMTLRLNEAETRALREHAEAEGRSMQDIVKTALHEHLAEAKRRKAIEQALTSELPRYREALTKLGE